MIRAEIEYQRNVELAIKDMLSRMDVSLTQLFSTISDSFTEDITVEKIEAFFNANGFYPK